MRLPDEREEREGLTPSIVSAIVIVVSFVLLLLAFVLFLNSDMLDGGNKTLPVASSQADSDDGYPDTKELIGDSNASPEDFDFWDLYPEPTATPKPTEAPKATVEVLAPSEDGKHTKILNRDGEEEWVLISPYLPKHEYDFTMLVCQSDRMKYYVDSKQISYVGIDVSEDEEYIDFNKVKKDGINFVMVRAGARGYGSGQLILDEYFTENVKRASDAGLDVGVYFFSQAINEAEAEEEANLVIQNLQGFDIEYPVAMIMDYVDNDTARIERVASKADKTTITKKFLETIKAAGYLPMLYGDKEWLVAEIDMSRLTEYDVWLSQHQDIPDYPYQFTMWQYSDTGMVDGISGYTNMNISFIDYSEK
ncbi:MAG: glycoside hydrolase family 25 protein [Lachnospiraceae bacterium]|nr:glycoside hydrolase family 25 protein [Lachnospiraceae bacterium]